MVGEDGIASLPEPMSVQTRLGAKLQNDILTDWKGSLYRQLRCRIAGLHLQEQAAASGTEFPDGATRLPQFSDGVLAAQETPSQSSFPLVPPFISEVFHAFCHQPHHRAETFLEEFFATARELGLTEVETATTCLISSARWIRLR